MIKISVAIPIYNTGEHITVTLDSLLHQTMDVAEFEVICVDDCSTDNSLEVIERYAEKMPNLKVVKRSYNSGAPSIPRNDAIEFARGEYIHFLDSDDFLGEEALERLYRAAQAYHSDVIFGRCVSVNGRTLSTIVFKEGTLPKADFIKNKLYFSFAPHKMFRRSFLKENGFVFHPGAMAGNEDELFLTQSYIAAKVITILADYDYYFVVSRGNESISRRLFPAETYFFITYRIMEFIDDYIKDALYKKEIKIIILDRLIKIRRVQEYLFTSRTTNEQKRDWLAGIHRFMNTHVDEELIQSLDPYYQSFWYAAKENSFEKFEQLQFGKALPPESRREKQLNITVRTNRAHITAYKRPSLNALQGSAYTKAGQVLQVHPTVKGWFEVRHVDKEGIGYAEFIQQKDVRYTFGYLFQATLQRIKSRTRKLLKNLRG